MHRVASIESIQAPSGHPARYTPENVHLVSLSFLHSHFSFEKTFKSDNAAVHGFQFTRPDNRRVNYFTTIKDAGKDRGEFPYPTIDEWIQSYHELIRKGEISPDDISILPLVQVRKGRKHFNTLCVYADEQRRLHVLVIEPREDNRMIFRDYPVQKTIAKLHTGFPDVEVIVENLMIGTQSRLDDTTCGAQHINALEVLSQLNTRVLEHHDQIKKYIATAVISRRDADNGIIHQYDRLINEKAQNIGQSELEKELLSADAEPKKEKERQPSTVDKTDNDDFEDVSHLPDVDNVYMQTSQLAQSKQINLQVNAQLQQKKRDVDAERLTLATMAINKYAPVNRNIFGFFAAHTRHETAIELVNILDRIKQDEDLSVNQRNYKAATFLYYCYTSMKKENGVLQSRIEEALVKLLDCALEFNHISGYARNERCIPLTQLFANRLRLMGMHMPNMNINFALIRDHMCVISSSDSSFKAKFSEDERRRIDTQRTDRFTQIRDELFKQPGQSNDLRLA